MIFILLNNLYTYSSIVIFGCISICASDIPNGFCGNGKYKYCEWVAWAPWSECSEGCGNGTRVRLNSICCPPGYTLQNISHCIENVCKDSYVKFTEEEGCASSGLCPTSMYM